MSKEHTSKPSSSAHPVEISYLVRAYGITRDQARRLIGRIGNNRSKLGEAARILGIDRVTLDQWVRDGRIKPHRGVGREAFFRTSEVEALYNELHPSVELAEAVAADEHRWQNVLQQARTRPGL